MSSLQWKTRLCSESENLIHMTFPSGVTHSITPLRGGRRPFVRLTACPTDKSIQARRLCSDSTHCPIGGMGDGEKKLTCGSCYVPLVHVLLDDP